MDSADDGSSSLQGGLVAGRFRLGASLGRGGFGQVFAAFDEQDGRDVAVKLLHAHLREDREVVTRFRREALAAASLGSPHIVEVLDSGDTEDGTPYLVMERLVGRSLTEVLGADSPLSVGRATRIGVGIAEALGAAHAAGIVHRDLKPDNVFLCEGDYVKLLDFGVSKFLEKVDTASLMTRTGAAVGTPFYMSPEQAQGSRDLDARADLYALGVILFFALTGEHPFEDDSYPMLVLKICTEPAPPLTRYRADVPQRLSELVARMLEKERAARPPDADAVREALMEFTDHEETPRRVEGVSARGLKPRVLSREPSPLESAPTTLAAQAAPADPAREPPQDEAVGVSAASGKLRLGLLGALGALVAGLGVWAVAHRREVPPPATPPPISLPVPAAPVVRPLSAPTAPGVGWSWLNPIPRAMPAWNDVDVGAPDRVALVGRAGLVARFEGGALLRWPSGLEFDLRAVAFTEHEQALVVGDRGGLALLDRQAGYQILDSHTDVDLHGVTRVGPLPTATLPRPPEAGDEASLTAARAARGAGTRAVVVGEDGTMLVVRGYGVTSVESGTELDLLAVHATADAVFAVGERGVVLRLAGGTVSVDRRDQGPTLRAVGGCPGRTLYAAGDDGLVLRRDAEGHWLPVTGAGDEGITDIACDGDRAVASGKRGGVFLLAGARMVRLESGSSRPLAGVGGAAGAPTFAVGLSGQLMTVGADHLRLLTAGPTDRLLAAGSLAGALVAVGSWGAIVRQGMRGFTKAESPTDAALAAVVSFDEATLLAFGDRGVVVRITYDGAEALDTGSHAGFRDAVSGGGEILAVGGRGALLRGAPGSFVESRVPDVETLWAVAGTPDDALAVGDDGAVVRLTRAGAQVSFCEPRITLRGVARLSAGDFVVGDGGRIGRLTDAGCEWEREGGDALYDVGRGPHGGPLAVGAGGVALERDETGGWRSVELGAGGVTLRKVFTTPRDVYVFGSGGAILRHPVL